MPPRTPDSWREHAERALRDAGYHRGGAREAVLGLLADQACALSAQEIDDRLRTGDRAVGRASVYRVLEQLAELKLVVRVEVGDGIARYEPNRPGGEHHHHVVCDTCGQIEPFEDPDLELAIHRLSSRLRFDVGEHDVVLRGECRACRS